MTISHLLESFEGSTPARETNTEGLKADEELAIFERGHKAGWDDCIAAQNSAAQALEENLAQNLRDLSFTYHEARSAVLQAIKPFIVSLVDTALPSFADKELGAKLAEFLHARTKDQISPQLKLSTHPSRVQFVQSILPQETPFEIELCEDTHLEESQITLAFSDAEYELDMQRYLEAISTLTNDVLSNISQN